MDHLDFEIARCRQARPRPVAMRLASAVFFVALQAVRLTCCAVLIMLEPVLRATLIPIAFMSFLVTLLFGFLIGAPRFPRWGMLAFSVGTLMVYWLYLGLMSLFMTPPPTHRR
ncbi:MAG: hypothetical protein JWQ73_3138 [Variovorax sp.]|nr:hypothetical protein [Variovorax sp.]